MISIVVACKENDKKVKSEDVEKQKIAINPYPSTENLESIKQVYNMEKSIAEEEFKQNGFYLRNGSSINSVIYFHAYWSRFDLSEENKNDYFIAIDPDKIRNISQEDKNLLEIFLIHRIDFYKLVYNLALDEKWIDILDLFINEDKYLFEIFLAIMTGAPGTDQNPIAKNISQTKIEIVADYFESFILEIFNLGPMETNEEYLNLHIVNYNGRMLESIVSNAGANEVLAQMANEQIKSYETLKSSLREHSSLSKDILGLPALLVDWLAYKNSQGNVRRAGNQPYLSENGLIIGESSNGYWTFLENNNASGLYLSRARGIASILFKPLKRLSFRKVSFKNAPPKFKDPKPVHPPLILRESSSQELAAFKNALRKKEAPIKTVEGYTEHHKRVLAAYYDQKKSLMIDRIDKLQSDIETLTTPQNRNAVLAKARQVSRNRQIKFDEKNLPKLIEKLVKRRQDRITSSRAEFDLLDRQYRESVATADVNLQIYIEQFNARQIYQSIR